jgi:5'-nucleotidase
MSVANWSALVGTAAALCTTLSFLPQLLRVRRHGGRDLSWTMLAMFLVGLSLWLLYGLLNDAAAVAVANAASILFVAAIVVMKFRVERQTSEVSRRLRIAIDMDEVMADALGEHVRRYNAAFGANIAIGDLAGRHLEECIPLAHREAAEAMLDASFFADLALLPDCQEVIREISERHEVFIASAAMDVPCSFDAKYRWLQRHFPFIPPSQIVFCGDKRIVDADYLIDDRARHFERFKGRPLLFSAPHNAEETRYPRVNSWLEIRELFVADAAFNASRGTEVHGVQAVQRFTVQRSSEGAP